MGTRDPRIDTYIANAADFAKPILIQIRDVVHAACPDVTEDLKWSSPTFMYHGLLCGMAAFKEHCRFGFWNRALVLPGLEAAADGSFNRFGSLKSVKDLPSRKDLAAFVKEAARLNESGVKAPRMPASPKKPIRLPSALKSAFAKNKKAASAFDGFSPSHKREYLEWITDAKTDATRDRRIAQAMVWMAQGKSRNWKYERR